MLCGTLLRGALSPLSDVVFLLLGRLLSRGSRSVVGSTSKPAPDPADRLWGDCQRASGLISGSMALPSGCGLKITYRRRTCHVPWRNAEGALATFLGAMPTILAVLTRMARIGTNACGRKQIAFALFATPSFDL